MKIAVVGSRSIKNFDISEYIPKDSVPRLYPAAQ